MRKRTGRTQTLSVSVDAETLAALKRRAARLYDGNVSAVIVELAADARVSEARHAFFEKYKIPRPSESELEEFDRNLRRARPLKKKKAA
jgi:hypothetical protein